MKPSSEDMSYVSRVTQLDSRLLDGEIFYLIKSQVANIFKYTGVKYLVKFDAEIEASLALLIYYYTVRRKRQSIGQQLLNIKYDKNVSDVMLNTYIVLLSLGVWLRKRISYISSLFKNERAKNVVEKTLNNVEVIYKAAEVTNILVFLVNGKYPSIPERVFRLNLVQEDATKERSISYNYFSRELLWHCFADLLTFVLPIIDVKKFHNFVKSIIYANENFSQGEEEEDFEFTGTVKCSLCGSLPILPQCYGCSHVACYYCIHTAMSKGPLFICSMCGYQLQSADDIYPVPYNIK